MPRWLAASISMTSRLPVLPLARSTQDGQTPHGVGVGPCTQFSERASTRALVVLPQPRGPENRYAWLIRPLDRAAMIGATAWSWPTTCSKVSGR